MYEVIDFKDLQKSKNECIRMHSALEEPAAGHDALEQLWRDSYRSGRPKYNRQGFYLRYNHEHTYVLTAGEDEPDLYFMPFLEGEIKSAENRTKLRIHWHQGIVHNIKTSLEAAIVEQCFALTEEYDEASSFQVDARIEVDIYEEDGELHIDAVYSNIAICKLISVPSGPPNFSDHAFWVPFREIPGEVFVQWKIKHNRAVMDKCTVNNDLLYTLLMERSVVNRINPDPNDVYRVTPKDVRQARQETKAVTQLRIALSNAIYRVKEFCDELPRDDYQVGIDLHNELRAQHTALFKNARLNGRESQKIVSNIQRALKNADRVFYKYPKWEGIAGNIIAALTGVGLIAMVIKAAYTSIKTGKASPLLFKTRKSRELDGVRRQINRVQFGTCREEAVPSSVTSHQATVTF